MRSIMWKSELLTGAWVKNWVDGLVPWLAATAVLVSAYVIGRISVDTLAFVEICTLGLSAIVLNIGNAMREPPEIVEQILFRTEHPARS